MFKRREFMLGSAAGVIALATAAGTAPAGAGERYTGRGRQPDLNHISKATFEALHGEMFELRDELTGQTAEVRLIEIMDEGSSAGLEQFSVRFRGVGDMPLAEAGYTLSHCSAGQCRLYLQTNTDRADSDTLRATFALLS